VDLSPPFRALTAVTVLLAVHSAAYSQEQTIVSIQKGEIEFEYEGASPLAILRAHLRAADEDLARKYAAELLGTLTTNPALEGCCPKTGAVRIIFAAHDPAGAPVIARVVLGLDPITASLTGLSGERRPIDDLFITEDGRSSLKTIVRSVAEEDPLLAHGGEVFKTAFGGLILASSTAIPSRPTVMEVKAAAVLPPAGQNLLLKQTAEWSTDPELELGLVASTAPPKPRVYIQWRRTVLPHPRGTVTMTDYLTVDDPVQQLMGTARDLQTSLVANPSSGACAKPLADRVVGELSTAAESADCLPGAGADACVKKLREAFKTAFQGVTPTTGCETVHFQTARMFERLAGQLPSSMTTTTILKNVPRSRWSVGLGTALLFGAKIDPEHPKVQIQNGAIAVSALPRLSSMAVVNWHPFPFRPRAVGMDGGRERVRAFGSLAFAPNFAVGGGLGFGVTRQVALNAGGMFILADTAAASRIEEKVKESVPFDARWIRTFFIGASFRLK
jgi:hypothetical protein